MPCNKSIFQISFFATLLAVVVFTGGCALKQQVPPPKPSPEAVRFLDQLGGVSQAHTTIKGLGRFKILTTEEALSGRMAWIAQRPDRLRLTILDPAGRPAALLATDGKSVWLDLRAEGKQYVKEARRFSLKRMVGIDVTLKDLIQVLLGEIPLGPYHRVEVDLSEGVGEARFFSSKEKPVAVLGYQETPFFVTQADYFDRAPALFLSLNRKAEPKDPLPQYPKELSFEDEARNRFYLRVDRFWVDPEVNPDLFQLNGFNGLPPDNPQER